MRKLPFKNNLCYAKNNLDSSIFKSGHKSIELLAKSNEQMIKSQEIVLLKKKIKYNFLMKRNLNNTYLNYKSKLYRY